MNKSEKEITRAFIHIAVSMSALTLIKAGMTPLQLFFVLLISISISMIHKYLDVPFLSFFLEKYGRSDEIKKFPGKGFITLLTGILLAYKIFPLDVAMVSISILGFLDPVSKIFGLKFGNTLNILDPKKKKYVEGHVVGGIASFLFSLMFVTPAEALVATLVGIVSESIIIDINGKSVDDNIVIPLATGSAILLMRVLIR